MQSVIGALRVNLGIDTAAFSDGLKSAQQSLKRAGEQMTRVGKTMSAAVTAPLAGFGALALRTAGNFEASMNQVAAVSGATGEQLAALRDTAKELGATTQFSASQAADAMKFLSMAGFDADQTIAALPGTLQLAASAAIELGDAADIVSNILSGYGMQVDELGRVNDVLVKTFTRTNTDLRQLGEAMKYAGPVAAAAGVGFEEAAAAIGMMGNAGIQGSMAGTSLRGAISRILAPTDGMATAMERAGLNFTDANGRILPLADILEQLAPHADDAGLFMQLFGQRAGPAMAALVSQGADSLRTLTAELEASGGTAERIANAQMQGFNGAMKELASAFEALQIAIAESGLLDFMTGLVKGLAEVIRNVSQADPQLLKFGTIFAGLAAAIGPVLVALGLMATGVAAIGAPVALVVAGIAALTAAVVAFWPEITNAATAVQGFVLQIGEAVAQIPETFRQMKDDALAHVQAMVDGITEWFSSSRLGRAVSTVTEGFSTITNGARDMWNDVVGNSWVPDMVLGVESWMDRLATSMPKAADTATGLVSDAFDGVGQTISGTMRRAADEVARGTFKMRDLMRGLATDLARSGLTALANAAGAALTTAVGSAFAGPATPAPTFSNVGGLYANGTPSARGGLSLVGERGPELVDMPRGARVHTNVETRRMMGGADGGSVRIMLDPGLRAEIVGEAEGRSIQIVQASQQGPQFAARVAAANRTATSSRMR